MRKSGRKCNTVAMATGARGEKRQGARQPRTRREARKQVCIPFKIPPWTFTREIFLLKQQKQTTTKLFIHLKMIRIGKIIIITLKSTEVLNPRRTLQWLLLQNSYNTSPKLCRSGGLWSILYIATPFDAKCKAF